MFLYDIFCMMIIKDTIYREESMMKYSNRSYYGASRVRKRKGSGLLGITFKVGLGFGYLMYRLMKEADKKKKLWRS